MKKPTLYVRIHYPGSVLEGEFDFDAVVKLKDKYMKYIETGKGYGLMIFNENKKKLIVIGDGVEFEKIKKIGVRQLYLTP